jgi:hypothetical protein
MTSRVLVLLAVVASVAACGTNQPSAGASPAASSAAATHQPPSGEVAGIFTITGGLCPGAGCEDAMSGVVMLTSASGTVRRIAVDSQNPLDYRLAQGRFAAGLPVGRYRISDEVSKARGGGACPVFVTGRRLQIPAPPHAVSAISIQNDKRTYVRINCFGH